MFLLTIDVLLNSDYLPCANKMACFIQKYIYYPPKCIIQIDMNVLSAPFHKSLLDLKNSITRNKILMRPTQTGVNSVLLHYYY